MNPSALDPRGPGAGAIAELWWVLFYASVIITVLTLAALGYAMFRRRVDWRLPSDEQDRAPTRAIVFAGILFPAIVIAGLFFYVVVTYRAITGPGDTPFTVRIIGVKWWWDVIYEYDSPNLNARTANEVRIPVGRRVSIALESRDVIHSFWVPQLQGKMDLVPGRTNRIWIQADSPGVYRGQCAEFCGLQHARMAFYVVAMEEAEFEEWIAAQRLPAAGAQSDAERRGREVYLTRGCPLCHAVRGTQSLAQAAPDLTHVGSRLSLAGGMLPNTRGYMAGWISNPQQIKPGSYMPRIPLEPAELQDIVSYVLSLR